MHLEELDLKELLEGDTEAGLIRFAGQPAIVFDAVALGMLRKELIDTFGVSVARGAGNTKFITRKLWGCANNPPFFHHGKFTTLREAILAHSGEALGSRQAFDASSDSERDSVVEFLKSLQIVPPGIKARIVDEHYRARDWNEDD